MRRPRCRQSISEPFATKPSRPSLATDKVFSDPRILMTAKALGIGFTPYALHFNDMVNADSSPWLQMIQTAIFGGDLFSINLPTVSSTEGLGVLVALIVLIVTFGSFVAAGMPLATALLGVAISTAGISLATRFATISSTTAFNSAVRRRPSGSTSKSRLAAAVTGPIAAWICSPSSSA